MVDDKPDQPSPADKSDQPAKTDGSDQPSKAGKPDAGDDKDEHPKARWPWIVGGAVVLVFVAVVLVLLLVPRSTVRTNDAYVAVRYASIAPQVSGKVVTVDVADNEVVHAGQLLMTLDDRPYRASLANAQATFAADDAQAEEAGTQVRRQPALIKQAFAQLNQSRAALLLSAPRAPRYTELSETGASSVEQRQQAVSQWRSDQAGVQSAQANLQATRFQLRGLRADHRSAKAKALADAALVDQARLNLSYTHVYAPFDGTVDQRTVEVGNYVTPGASVMVVVPLGAVYVTANFREPALRHMRPGQRARIHVDAYDIWLDGVVQSLPAASGSTYSPLPPTNATGNFTKIVQRLPVKITVLPNQPLARLLRVGLSVEAEVDTGLADVVQDQRQAPGQVTAPYPAATPNVPQSPGG